VIVLTTCRRPTQRIRSFTKDISHSHPATTILSRGKLGLVDLATATRKFGSNQILVISRWMGGPGRIEFLSLDSNRVSLSSTLYLKNVRLQREYDTHRAPRAEIVTTSEKIHSETARFAKWYSELFGMRLIDSEMAGSYNASIHVSDDTHTIHVSLTSPPAETEVGPSFTIRQINWKPMETFRNEEDRC
jgi:rRNA maturation protein Rpf1